MGQKYNSLRELRKLVSQSLGTVGRTRYVSLLPAIAPLLLNSDDRKQRRTANIIATNNLSDYIEWYTDPKDPEIKPYVERAKLDEFRQKLKPLLPWENEPDQYTT